MARQGLEIKHRRELHPVRWFVWTVLVVILVVSGWFAYRWYISGELPSIVKASALTADPRVDETKVTDSEIKSHNVPRSHPRYISIPKLSVQNTRVFAGGVDTNNILQSPERIDDTTWFEKSATPGAGFGAVLIDGHNGGMKRDGIFAGLKTLVKGDSINVERGDGKVFTYTVDENQSMSLDEVNKTGMQMMMQSVDATREGLNLITCDGVWVPRLQQFDRRIMLRAVIK